MSSSILSLEDDKIELIPIENILQYNATYLQCYFNSMMKELVNKPLVKRHQLKIGKQTKCLFLGKNKYWVWEYDNWSLFVSNKKGVIINVLSDASVDEAWSCFEKYVSLMKSMD
jgi:hypothetical protein